jgi:hypothetical protein
MLDSDNLVFVGPLMGSIWEMRKGGTDRVKHKLTILDSMVIVAAAAVGCWAAAAYRAWPLPLVAGMERLWIPVIPLILSGPIVTGLTWALLAVPLRTLRERTRDLFGLAGAALCAAAAVSSLAVLIHCLLRVCLTPFVDGSAWIYGALLLYDLVKWGGLGVVAVGGVLALGGRFHQPRDAVEWVRLGLAGYWVALFVVFSGL